MSQWGEVRIIDGYRFIPHVAGRPFEPLSDEHTIEFVEPLDRVEAGSAAFDAACQFVGKTYAEWLKRPDQQTL
jgi:hypothetical protein